MKKHTKEQIIAEFKKLIEKLGKVPSQELLKVEKFIIAKSGIHRIFGSYNNLINICGFEPNLIRGKRINCICKYCLKQFTKKESRIKKSLNDFCSKHCNGKYMNANKKHGTKVSKLEKYIRQELSRLYPTLEIHYNQTNAIKAELDIYIPSFRLAFELNGIFHYEPIFGQEKLEKTKNTDSRKFQACIKESISLCIIDVSQQKYFKIESSKKYLDIIVNIINEQYQN
jgi:hypothetical protein